MSALDTALSLAKHGYYVFPLSDEHYLVKWTQEATTDRATISRWWKRWPDARIGIHCGMSELVAVDLDRKNGKDGFKSLKVAGRELPPTFNYTSRSGKGEHHIYRAPAGEVLTIANSVHGMAGVDIRSGNGLVIYSGPKISEAPTLSPAPEWAIVHKKAEDFDPADVEAWLAAERKPEPRHESLYFVNQVPFHGVENGDLLKLLTPIVRSLKYGYGRRRAYELALRRYTRHYQLTEFVDAFNRAWGKAVARMEHDWQEKRNEASKPSSEDDLFDQSSILGHIRQWADAQEARPEAALAVVLARLSSNISPRVVLPRVGSLPYASLNLFVALEGKSGHGKNGLIDGVDELMPRPFIDDPVEKVDGASSGEGLITVFVDRIKDKETGGWKTVQKTSRAFVAIDEIDTLEGVASRSGNIILSVLRSLWSGTGVSTPTADPTRQRKLAPHTYRLSFLTGIQPGRGQVIFDQAAKLSGTTQRFVFAKVANPLPDDAPYADDPGPLEYRVHESIPYDQIFDQGGRELNEPQYVLPVAEDITAFIRLNLRRSKHEDSKALDGHWVQVRLRVAALLAVLHGKPGVDQESWNWADVLMKHSNEVRRRLMDALADGAREHHAARGRADAVRADADEALLIVHVQEKVLKAIRDGKHARAAIRSPLSPRQRDVLDAALHDLADRGVIVREQKPGRGTDAVRYVMP